VALTPVGASVHIKAFLPASLIEYPEHIADVIYVGECNFRCPFCYNVDLVLHAQRLPDLDPDKVLARLEGRRGFIDALAITGGEPTLQSDLVGFLGDVRGLGLAVKLDTNGYRPDVLRDCLDRKLVDYVAMDIKSCPEGYAAAAGVAVDTERIKRSVELLLASEVEHEFRTTVVPGLTGQEDVEGIVRLIAGAKRYYLQCFRPGETVGWGLHGPHDPPSAELMQSMLELARPDVRRVEIRGLAEPLSR
jgi:pyruvate formate lyase activating enzyme